MTRRQTLKGFAALLAAAPGVKVGVAETTVTPPWPSLLWGYGGPMRYSTGVRDDLFARAFLFEAGRQFLAVTIDVGGIGFPLYRRIARAIHAATGIAEDGVMIQCTHTHAAPALIGMRGIPPDGKFQDLVVDRLIHLAAEAKRALAPAALAYGRVSSSIGLNRRVSDRRSTWNKDSGPIDDNLGLLLINTPEGRARAALVNYASHPVTLRANNLQISADFPGVLCRELRAALGCPVGYMQGCCGDTIPKVFGGLAEMEDYGRKMAAEALRAVAVAAPLAGGGLEFQALRVPVTFVAPYSLDDFRTRYATLAREPGATASWAKEYLRYLEDGGDTRQTHDTLVQALRIGDLAMCILPGEILHHTALAIRGQFPGRKLMVAAYANDTSVGYLPPAEEFPKGGYEVDEAWLYYGLLKTTPQVEKDVRVAAAGLLQKLLK